MTEQNKSYQISFFINPNLNQEQRDKTVDDFKKWIINQGGSLTVSLSEPSRKNLAYPIKKMREAFYLNLGFTLAPEKLNQMIEYLNLEKDQIIRYLIAAPAKPISSRQPRQPKEKTQTIREAFDFKIVDKVEPLKAVPEDKRKLRIEELDKKLEEILNQ